MLTTSTPLAARSNAFKILGALLDTFIGYYVGQQIYIRKSDSLERILAEAPSGVIATTMIQPQEKPKANPDDLDVEGDVADEEGWMLPGGVTRADLLKLITL